MMCKIIIPKMCGSILLKYQPLTITRYSNGGYYREDGEWIVGSTSPLTIQASVQPYQKSEQQIILPEGVTEDDVRLVMTKSQLQTASEYNNNNADTTVIEGHVYEAFSVKNWTLYNTSHNECIFVRKDKIPARI